MLRGLRLSSNPGAAVWASATACRPVGRKKKISTSKGLKTIFAKIFRKTPVKLDTLKEKLVDPLERVLPQELKGPWLTWFAKWPQAIGELVNSLPAKQGNQADCGIEPSEHAAISQYLLAGQRKVTPP